MRFLVFILTLSGAGAAFAAPAPEPTIAARDGGISNLAQLTSALSSLSAQGGVSPAAYTSLMSAIVPSPAPIDSQQAASRLAVAQAALPTDFLGAGGALLISGMTGGQAFDPGNPANDVQDFGACNNANNSNPRSPSRVIYPKASSSDAPYDVTEAQLRAAIYIPPEFTYGNVRPAIFIPGTGVEACENFAPNLGQLFKGSNYADPVYLNVPQNMLMDAQTNAEYVAYAINYISAISGNKNVSIITWSQGGPASQWALKYWPSTRKYVSDLVAISPDYHGTILAPILCPPGIPCAPSVLQQNYNANFIKALRSNGGDSAYVPTTNIWSIFDEIVEPQQFPFASAMLNDARGVGVSNVQIQNTCLPGTPAGGPNFGHENSIYNAVSFAVAKDALTNNGPGSISRSMASAQCSNFFATGLGLTDVFATEFLILLAGFNIETYSSKVTTEPPIKSYAL